MRPSALLLLLLLSTVAAAAEKRPRQPKLSPEGEQCLQCHAESTPGIVAQWRGSSHHAKGVDCYGCHRANEKDPSVFDHYGLKIAVIVTPFYCARCHQGEVDQFEKSRHANAAQFIGSLDNMLGEIVEGGPAASETARMRNSIGERIQFPPRDGLRAAEFARDGPRQSVTCVTS